MSTLFVERTARTDSLPRSEYPVSRNRNVTGPNGNRLYALSYTLSSMRAYPFRALSLALTLSLGVSLITSVMIWADTGVQVSLDDYFDENAFQMVVQTSVGKTEDIGPAETFIRNSPLIESVLRVNSTVGLVSGTNLPGNTVYGIEEPVYTEGIKDCEVVFVDNTFLDLVSRDFTTEGKFRLGLGEVLVSDQFVNYVHEVFDTVVTINSTIDIELLTTRPAAKSGPLSELGRVSLKSLTVVGVYEVEGYGSLIEKAFPSIMRSSYENLNYDLPVLGIRDSVMILSETLNLNLIPETGFFGAQSFVRASSAALTAAGIDKIADNLLTLKARVDEEYDVAVEGLGEVLYIQGIVDIYSANTPLAALNLPIFILAIFLSVFAADTFMASRSFEVSALRSKGASSTQVYGVFISESIIVAAVSLGLGLLLSILFAALIPSTVSFLQFDMESYTFYLRSTVLRPSTVINSIGICMLPPLVFILNAARKAARTEIGAMLVEQSEPVVEEKQEYSFTIGLSIALLAMVLASAVFLPGNSLMLLLELALGTAAWFFMAYNGSKVTRVGLSRVSARLTFLLGEKNLIAAGNLRNRRGRIIPLMVVLALTMSSTVAFTVQAESFHTDLRQEISYAIGADMRVSCTARPFSFNTTIEQYPGVNRALPVLTTWGKFGLEELTIEAVDAAEYSVVGHFDSTSFNGLDSTYVLSLLASTENGIVLSSYHADRWNKTVGDSLTLTVGGRLSPAELTFSVVALMYSAPGFGYASTVEAGVSRLGAGFGFQARLSGFGLANIDFISESTGIATASTFLADLLCITDQDLVIRALSDLPGVAATTPDKFDLAGASFGTALYLSTVVGLSSIGFLMSLLLSFFALTLFLGSIVKERTRDYAILRAVGTSRRQVARVVLSEFSGIVLASLTISVVLGAVFGFSLSVIVFSMSPYTRVLPPAFIFPIGFLTVVLLSEMFAMIAGAYLPAREASKTDPAIVLRNL